MLATAVEAGRANVQSITMVASERPLDCSCNCIAPCIRTVDCFCDDSFAWYVVLPFGGSSLRCGLTNNVCMHSPNNVWPQDGTT